MTFYDQFAGQLRLTHRRFNAKTREMIIEGIRPMRSVRAFTLMETIVVIAIMAIITALLCPSLKSASTQINTTKCLSNLRQIWLTSMQYASDNDGDIVHSIGFNASVDPLRSLSWDRMLQTYSRTTLSVNGSRPFGIYACPASKTPVTNATSWGSDYGKNAFVNGNYLTATVSYKIAGLTRPGEVILFGDGLSRDLWGHAPPYNLNARHAGKANLLYADGHGESTAPAKISSSDVLQPPWFP